MNVLAAAAFFDASTAVAYGWCALQFKQCPGLPSLPNADFSSANCGSSGATPANGFRGTTCTGG
jgi:hypothetical protein